MPIYEYKCQKCGHKFEELVLGSEEIKCPRCGSKRLKKLLSSFSVYRNTGSSNDSGSCSSGVCPIHKE